VSLDVDKLLATNKAIIVPIDKLQYPTSDVTDQLLAK